MPPISFSGTHDQETYFSAVDLISRTTPVSTFFRILGVAILLLVFGGTVYLFIGQGERTTEDIVRLALRVFTMPVLIYVLLRPYIDAPVIKKRLWSDPATTAPQAGIIDEEGVTLNGMGGSTVTRWEQVIRVRTTADLLAIQALGSRLIVLPRRFFSSEADWQAALRLAETARRR